MPFREKRLIVLSNSELNVLRACAWKHHLKFELQLDPVGGRDGAGPLNVGTLTHAGIAAVYRALQKSQRAGDATPTKDWLRVVVEHELATHAKAAREMLDMFGGGDADEERAAQEEDIKTAANALELFVEHIALPRYDRYRVLAVEMPFRVPLVTNTPNRRALRFGDELEGVIDVVLLDTELRRILPGEHKSTVSDAHSYDLMLSTDSQVPLYVYALRRIFGESVSGAVMLNVIRKSVPREPSINKDGTVSIAAVDTTRDVYQRALDAQVVPEWAYGEKPNKEGRTGAQRWAELQAKQARRRDTLAGIERFVCQHEEQIGDDQVTRAARDAWNGARLIRLFRRGAITPWRNGGHCNDYGRLCPYHAACTTDVTTEGELLIGREHRHPEVIEAGGTLGPGAVQHLLEELT